MMIEKINKKYNWTEWSLFPNPLNNEYIYAPFGPGVYQLRNKMTNEYILFGEGKNLSYRMASLLPEPYGCGKRNNQAKRDYVWEHLKDLEYRTVAFKTKKEALELQRELKKLKIHIFNT